MAVSEPRKMPVEVRESRAGWGRGRGREKRRECWRRRAVGEEAALDMAWDMVSKRTALDGVVAINGASKV